MTIPEGYTLMQIGDVIVEAMPEVRRLIGSRR